MLEKQKPFRNINKQKDKLSLKYFHKPISVSSQFIAFVKGGRLGLFSFNNNKILLLLNLRGNTHITNIILITRHISPNWRQIWCVLNKCRIIDLLLSSYIINHMHEKITRFSLAESNAVHVQRSAKGVIPVQIKHQNSGLRLANKQKGFVRTNQIFCFQITLGGTIFP